MSQTKQATQSQTASTQEQPAKEKAPERAGLLEDVLKLEELAKKYSVDELGLMASFHRTLAVADGLEAFRTAMSPAVMKKIMALRGSSLGFRTDRDTSQNKPAYTETEVKECAIEALLRGFLLVGNEFNIIAGRFYGTKEGYERKIREFPELTNVQHFPGVPKIITGASSSGATVNYKITAIYKGEPVEIDRGGDFAIPVRVNEGMGADAILGKARRKMLKFLYDHLTGSVFTGGDADIDDVEPMLAKAASDTSLLNRLGSRVDELRASKANQVNETRTTEATPSTNGETKPAESETTGPTLESGEVDGETLAAEQRERDLRCDELIKDIPIASPTWRAQMKKIYGQEHFAKLQVSDQLKEIDRLIAMLAKEKAARGE